MATNPQELLGPSRHVDKAKLADEQRERGLLHLGPATAWQKPFVVDFGHKQLQADQVIYSTITDSGRTKVRRWIRPAYPTDWLPQNSTLWLDDQQ